MIKMEDLVPVLKEEINQHKNFSFPIHGTSMIPLLHTGDIVKVSKIIDLKKNDIILYQRKDNSYVLHRLIKIKNEEFIFIGDHQTKQEFGIKKEMMIAKVITYRKKNKKKEYKLCGFKYKTYLFLLKFKIMRKVMSRLK